MNEWNSNTFLQWIEGKRNQQQPPANIKRQSLPSIDTFMKRLRQGGIIIAASSESRFVNGGEEGMRETASPKND